MKPTRLILLLVLLPPFAAGCQMPAEELTALKQLSHDFHQELGQARADLVLVEDPAERAKLEKWIDKAEPVVAGIDAQIHAGENGLAIGEIVISVVGGFFPPALALLPILRTLRRNRKSLKTVFASVATGGGPKDAAAAKSVLIGDPIAYAEFQKFKRLERLADQPAVPA